MKFVAITSFLVSAALGTVAQITDPSNNYNVTSPLADHPYVVGQQLPCSYAVLPDQTAPVLSINLTSTTDKTKTFSILSDVNGSNTTNPINYLIPDSVSPGNYDVVFTDKNTNSKLQIPVEIRPKAATPTTTSMSSPGASNSGFPTTGASSMGSLSMGSPGLTTKTLLALAAVACVALML